jgi:hypothetical protein
MKYAENLVYDNPKATKQMNNADFDLLTIQKLSLANISILSQIKNQVPPVLISFERQQGFYVTAAQEIASLTLICEYVGQVRNGL